VGLLSLAKLKARGVLSPDSVVDRIRPRNGGSVRDAVWVLAVSVAILRACDLFCLFLEAWRLW
jgi:hypothetical protein